MLTSLDYIVIVLVVALMIVILKIFAPKLRNAEDYYIASRSIPFSLLVGTLVATWYGGQGMLNSVESAAVYGLASWGIWCVGAHISRVPLALWFAPKVSIRTEMTVPQMVKTAYGNNISLFMAFFILIAFLCIGEVVALRNVLAAVFGEGPAVWLVPLTLALVVGIAAFGGMMGVAVTDMLMFWCLCVAAAMAVPPIMTMAGGLDGLQAQLLTIMGAERTAMMFNPVYGAEMLGVVTMLVMSFSVYVDASLYQRFSAAQTPRAASRSYLTCFCIFIMLDLMLCVSGICMAAIAPGENIAQAYVKVVMEVLPGGLRALFFIGIVGAIISTLDSCWLVSGMTVSNDIVQRFKPLTDRQNIQIGRAVVVLTAVVAYLCAFSFTRSLDVTIFINTMRMSATFVVTFMGVFYKGRKTLSGAWMTIVTGSFVYFILTFMHPVTTQHGRLNGMLVALPVALIVFFVGNRFGDTLEEHEQKKRLYGR